MRAGVGAASQSLKIDFAEVLESFAHMLWTKSGRNCQQVYSIFIRVFRALMFQIRKTALEYSCRKAKEATKHYTLPRCQNSYVDYI